jgi:hypothetical protein
LPGTAGRFIFPTKNPRSLSAIAGFSGNLVFGILSTHVAIRRGTTVPNPGHSGLAQSRILLRGNCGRHTDGGKKHYFTSDVKRFYSKKHLLKFPKQRNRTDFRRIFRSPFPDEIPSCDSRSILRSGVKMTTYRVIFPHLPPGYLRFHANFAREQSMLFI